MTEIRDMLQRSLSRRLRQRGIVFRNLTVELTEKQDGTYLCRIDVDDRYSTGTADNALTAAGLASLAVLADFKLESRTPRVLEILNRDVL